MSRGSLVGIKDLRSWRMANNPRTRRTTNHRETAAQTRAKGKLNRRIASMLDFVKSWLIDPCEFAFVELRAAGTSSGICFGRSTVDRPKDSLDVASPRVDSSNPLDGT